MLPKSSSDMTDYESGSEISPPSYKDEQEEGLLTKAGNHNPAFKKRKWRWTPCLVTLSIISMSINIAQLLMVIMLGREVMRSDRTCVSEHDPSVSVWSPANDAVEWIPIQRHQAALFNGTDYMGFPNPEKEKLWSDLYNFGISKISKEEADKLPTPTLPIPGTEDYLVQLDVWHELHCLNDLRKTLYPEYFPEMSMEALRQENGTFTRDNNMFRHWDHCIDSLRQVIMCHADVAPISFHVNVPASFGIFPRLATSHTCRNFTKIQEWGKAHEVGDWNYNLTTAEADKIIATAGFDQSPEEDIQFLYKLFPGDKFFDYWKTHEVPPELLEQQEDTED